MAELFQQAETLNKLEFSNACAHYYVVVNQDSTARHDVFNKFQKHLLPTTQEKFMTMPEAFIEDGRKEGLLIGRQEGIQTGIEKGLQKGRQKLQALLEKQVQRRFPHNAKKFQQQINEADSDLLSFWIEKMMDATSIEDVFVF
ncbi:MAG: hypothetical protein ACH346_06045 [Chthoniobacterales bacterium]